MPYSKAETKHRSNASYYLKVKFLGDFGCNQLELEIMRPSGLFYMYDILPGRVSSTRINPSSCIKHKECYGSAFKFIIEQCLESFLRPQKVM